MVSVNESEIIGLEKGVEGEEWLLNGSQLDSGIERGRWNEESQVGRPVVYAAKTGFTLRTERILSNLKEFFECGEIGELNPTQVCFALSTQEVEGKPESERAKRRTKANTNQRAIGKHSTHFEGSFWEITEKGASIGISWNRDLGLSSRAESLEI
jgi:hypothetical protein